MARIAVKSTGGYVGCEQHFGQRAGSAEKKGRHTDGKKAFQGVFFDHAVSHWLHPHADFPEAEPRCW